MKLTEIEDEWAHHPIERLKLPITPAVKALRTPLSGRLREKIMDRFSESSLHHVIQDNDIWPEGWMGRYSRHPILMDHALCIKHNGVTYVVIE